MKLTTITLSPVIARWSDPGGREPNGAGSPRSGYDYIEDVTGEVVIELEDDDAALSADEFDDMLFTLLLWSLDDRLSGMIVKDWGWKSRGRQLVHWVRMFDAGGCEIKNGEL